MSEPLTVAVPSKGRLQDNAAAFFARAGLKLVQAGGSRDYRGHFAGVEGVEVLFLSASEIAKAVANGQAHLGVTGEDLVRETIPDADSKLMLLAPLGFGHANVVVAVPRAWIDVTTMADLDDVAHAMRAASGERLRVATKFVTLTRRFFGRHGLADYRIVESTGATEGAPASGAAEIIVDITTSGATLAANALKVLEDGVILRSEAHLVASLTTPWAAEPRAAAASLLQRISAAEAARTTREVVVEADPEVRKALLEASVAHRARPIDFGSAAGPALAFLCPRDDIQAFGLWLVQNGARTVAVRGFDYLFSSANTLWDRLNARLPAS